MSIRALSPILLFMCLVMSSSATTFPPNFGHLWGFDHIAVAGDGNVALLLDKQSGAGFISKATYSSGKFSTRMKLVPGDSAGTISTFYLSSNESVHNKLDLEFRGNLSGEPMILQTNIFVKDVGGREQGIKLWFDPTKKFYSYSIFWNEHLTMFHLKGGLIVGKICGEDEVGSRQLSRNHLKFLRLVITLWRLSIGYLHHVLVHIYII